MSASARGRSRNDQPSGGRQGDRPRCRECPPVADAVFRGMLGSLISFSAEVDAERDLLEFGRPLRAIDAFSFDGLNARGGDAVFLLEDRGRLGLIGRSGEGALADEIRKQLQAPSAARCRSSSFPAGRTRRTTRGW